LEGSVSCWAGENNHLIDNPFLPKHQIRGIQVLLRRESLNIKLLRYKRAIKTKMMFGNILIHLIPGIYQRSDC
jgi:hypothetical protein